MELAQQVSKVSVYYFSHHVIGPFFVKTTGNIFLSTLTVCIDTSYEKVTGKWQHHLHVYPHK